MLFLFLASSGPGDTLGLDDRLVVSSVCLVGIVDELDDTVDQVGICPIVHGSDFDAASALYAWGMMCAIDWGKVSPVAASQ